MEQNNHKSFREDARGGYIAVISAVIITAIVITVSFMLSNSNYLGRFDTQFSEMRETAKNAARGCLEHARLKLAESASYSGSEVVTIGSSTCSILPIEVQGNEKIIKAHAEINLQRANLRLRVDKNLETVSFEDVENF